MPAILLSMHLAEYLIVDRKAGKAVWSEDLRCFLHTALYGFMLSLPMKLEIE